MNRFRTVYFLFFVVLFVLPYKHLYAQRTIEFFEPDFDKSYCLHTAIYGSLFKYQEEISPIHYSSFFSKTVHLRRIKMITKKKYGVADRKSIQYEKQQFLPSGYIKSRCIFYVLRNDGKRSKTKYKNIGGKIVEHYGYDTQFKKIEMKRFAIDDHGRSLFRSEKCFYFNVNFDLDSVLIKVDSGFDGEFKKIHYKKIHYLYDSRQLKTIVLTRTSTNDTIVVESRTKNVESNGLCGSALGVLPNEKPLPKTISLNSFFLNPWYHYFCEHYSRDSNLIYSRVLEANDFDKWIIYDFVRKVKRNGRIKIKIDDVYNLPFLTKAENTYLFDSSLIEVTECAGEGLKKIGFSRCKKYNGDWFEIYPGYDAALSDSLKKQFQGKKLNSDIRGLISSFHSTDYFIKFNYLFY